MCLSVWGGFGEERLLKTSGGWEDETPALVDPNCSLRLARRRCADRRRGLRKRCWVRVNVVC